MITKYKLYSIALLLFVSCFSLHAQNQLSQSDKVKTAVNIKIDGKPADWNPALRMHNSSTDVDYYVTNDDKNFYLMIQSKDGVINKKLFGGGVTLTLNSTGKFGGMDFVSMKYPTISDRSQTVLSQLISDEVPEGNQQSKKEYTDSILNLINKTLIESAKEIQVVGVKEINDVIISVYNEYGIKAALQFQDKKTLTYEIAVPLKYFAALTVNNNKFFYNIKLNGISNTRNTVVHQTSDGPVTVTTVPHGLLSRSLSNSGFQIMSSATDFWSEYKIKQ
jgi:hypothetical protein